MRFAGKMFILVIRKYRDESLSHRRQTTACFMASLWVLMSTGQLSRNGVDVGRSAIAIGETKFKLDYKEHGFNAFTL